MIYDELYEVHQHGRCFKFLMRSAVLGLYKSCIDTTVSILSQVCIILLVLS